VSYAKLVALLILGIVGIAGSSQAQMAFPSEYEHDLFCAATLLNAVYDNRLSAGGNVSDPAVQEATRNRSYAWAAKAVEEGKKTGLTVEQVEADVNDRSRKIQNVLEHDPSAEWLEHIQATMKQCD
jgi:hypothetical protein